MTLPQRSGHRRYVEVRTGKALEVALRELYVDQMQSQESIARAFGVSRSTVGAWLRAAGIERPVPPPITLPEEV